MDHIGNVYDIPLPYIVYCGDVEERLYAKVASGLLEWSSHKIIGKINDANNIFPETEIVDLELTEAKTLVIGSAPIGGKLNTQIIDVALKALGCGLNVASGLHDKLSDNPLLVQLARMSKLKLFDFRYRPDQYPLGTGLKRSGLRVLTVGTDCSCGKKYTALSMYKAIRDTVPAVFCSTGQTGFLISGSGINNDTITADFLSGAAEVLSPNASPDTVFLIEGQGAIRHPSYAGGAVSLLTGSQPDYLVMCHTPGRETMLGTKRIISISSEIEANLSMSRFHGHIPKILGLSLNAPPDSLSEFGGLTISSVYSSHSEYFIPAFNPKFGGPSFDDICQILIDESFRRRLCESN